MTETKPTYTIDSDMAVNCTACNVPITISNAGGYRTYCERCAEMAVKLQQAQAAIEAMLQECFISQVIITVDGKHNRYSYRDSNVPYRFDTLTELWQDNAPDVQPVQGRLV